MRLFQNSQTPREYLARCAQLPGKSSSFRAQIDRLLDDRYGAVHILGPVLDGEDTAFFTAGNDEGLQRAWARENGMPAKASLEDILRAQIESHRTEVFYNLDPMRYGSDFVRKLPGCVRRSIAWRAAPSPGGDFAAYDLVVCNFPAILKSYEQRAWKAAHFSPSYDPAMEEYAKNDERPIDVLFIGTYSRLQMQRAVILKAVLGLRNRYRVEFRLACSRLTRLAESPLGYFAPVGKYRRPREMRSVSGGPVYGRELYSYTSRAKIVLNGHGEISAAEKGNMRCFEGLGLRSLLLSDEGIYPAGMEAGKTLATYQSVADVAVRIEELLSAPELRNRIADAGHNMLKQQYSKQQQWKAFCSLASGA